jgi:hypothetical protein
LRAGVRFHGDLSRRWVGGIREAAGSHSWWKAGDQLVTFPWTNDTIAGEAVFRLLTRLFSGVRAMAGIIFAVAIALATILCVGVVIWASDY